ncbi:MAG: PhnD/SsuA/transferrin family substrate-binding protein, partial [Planctomycetota bacterium]|nr:PhnD/SsuA/transferrin family substrate-binding protein [Planctomycetota bacterium]
MKRPLRAITYLSPGIPLGFFEHLAELLATSVGRPVEIQTEERISGPMQGDHDPFAAGAADLGFLCAPSYLYLVAQPAPSVELLPAAFVFRDPRNAGRPVLFSDVIVRADSGAHCLDDLRGTRFGFNDRCSLSGYYSLRQELRARGLADRFFREERCTGSHHASIEAVRAGSVEVAAIDSNVLLLESRRRPELADQLRILETWGPFPIQPIVAA